MTEELSSLRDDPTGVGELARTADESATCWVEDTDIRADPPPERFVFDYEHGELTVIVYYEVENGELGPFQVWGVPDCADLVVIGEPENP